MIDLEKQIKELESQLTGNMFEDMDIQDQIHQLKMQSKGVSPSCGMDGGECENCGS